MLDGKRKSMQAMAARLGVDHQQLQQFLTSPTWDHVEVQKRLARWADEFMGNVGNCQIGVSVHAVTDWASAAINRALFVPKSWDDTTTSDAGIAAEIMRRRLGARSRTGCGTGRNGGWRWTCSTRSPARRMLAAGPVGGWRRGWLSRSRLRRHHRVASRPGRSHDYRELEDGLGVDHFEGRSYIGSHRHMTLSTLAKAFCTSYVKTRKAPVPAWLSTPPPASSRSSTSGPAAAATTSAAPRASTPAGTGGAAASSARRCRRGPTGCQVPPRRPR